MVLFFEGGMFILSGPIKTEPNDIAFCGKNEKEARPKKAGQRS